VANQTTKAVTDHDELVPDQQVRAEFGITRMTLYRWSEDPTLGFPPKILIRDRGYRSRHAVEAFKARMLAQAIRQRSRAQTTNRSEVEQIRRSRGDQS
jgi:hypothetical protein